MRILKRILFRRRASTAIFLLLFSSALFFTYWITSYDPEFLHEKEFLSRVQHEKKAGPDGHRLCLIVPFRERFEELLIFVPRISTFLKEQGVSFTILVVNQVDNLRFNRGSLINVGFTYSQNNQLCDYIAMHDVDLLPKHDALKYEFPEKGPFHLSPPGLHPRYDYPTFIGGILLLTSNHFQSLNGMSNRFWGWGLEDDEFYARIKETGLVISKSTIKTTPEEAFVHIHSSKKRKRDSRKCYNQRDMTRRRDRETGLTNLNFSLLKANDFQVDGSEAKVLNVQLFCDHGKTPWCDCSNAPKTEAPLRPIPPKDKIMPDLKGTNRGLRTKT